MHRTRLSDKEFTIPELLPPSEDGVFKTLLTHPDAKPVLRDIISSILQIPVVDVEVKNTELPIADIGEKRERLDVNCRIDGGSQADVEMQTAPIQGDSAASGHANLKSRAIYYLCDLHASQEGRGFSYDRLMRSYQITFCGYTVFPEREGFISRFGFRDERGAELLDTVGIVFIELSKLGSVMKKPVEEMTSAEMWGIFFGYGSEPEYRGLLDRMISVKGEIKMASELLANISKDDVERAHYRSRKMFQ
ncbi:MAG: Rpn family recombination-promoting nuclease/putative transposase, partial [Treponema sp.]|nr:Rpn family recombination-promoting nuclease/putative transposase [Treponema sp.]